MSNLTHREFVVLSGPEFGAARNVPTMKPDVPFDRDTGHALRTRLGRSSARRIPARCMSFLPMLQPHKAGSSDDAFVTKIASN